VGGGDSAAPSAMADWSRPVGSSPSSLANDAHLHSSATALVDRALDRRQARSVKFERRHGRWTHLLHIAASRVVASSPSPRG
jgi:hypothetical protein